MCVAVHADSVDGEQPLSDNDGARLVCERACGDGRDRRRRQSHQIRQVDDPMLAAVGRRRRLIVVSMVADLVAQSDPDEPSRVGLAQRDLHSIQLALPQRSCTIDNERGGVAHRVIRRHEAVQHEGLARQRLDRVGCPTTLRRQLHPPRDLRRQSRERVLGQASRLIERGK